MMNKPFFEENLLAPLEKTIDNLDEQKGVINLDEVITLSKPLCISKRFFRQLLNGSMYFNTLHVYDLDDKYFDEILQLIALEDELAFGYVNFNSSHFETIRNSYILQISADESKEEFCSHFVLHFEPLNSDFIHLKAKYLLNITLKPIFKER